MGRILKFFASILNGIASWFARNPHRIFWVVIIAMASAVLLGWVPVAIISYVISTTVVLAITNSADDFIFAPRGNGVTTLFSRNKFASRWDGFPMFLIEIFAIAWGGSVLDDFLESTLAINPLPMTLLIVWMGGLVVYYWFVGSRAD